MQGAFEGKKQIRTANELVSVQEIAKTENILVSRMYGKRSEWHC